MHRPVDALERTGGCEYCSGVGLHIRLSEAPKGAAGTFLDASVGLVKGRAIARMMRAGVPAATIANFASW
jgi:hypothetical protein